MLDLVEMEIKLPQETFTHYNGDENTWITFLVETMKEFAEKYSDSNDVVKMNIPINKELAVYNRKNRGIEQDRIDRLKTPYLFKPVIAVEMPQYSSSSEMEVMVVDGNHRITKLAEIGRRKIPTYLFKYPFWRNFILPEDAQQEMLERGGFLDNPHDIVNHKSNILENEQENRK